MRRTLIWSFSAIVVVTLLAGLAMSAPSSVSYQGRLTNSVGAPVADGSYAVTFSIWTDSVGGSMIWSESQNIDVSGGGLFSTYLGNLQPLGGDLIIHGDEDLYIQTSVGGTPLVPRMAIGTVPHASVSSSLNSNTPDVGSLHASVGDDTTRITATHSSFTNLLDSYVHLVDDRAMLGLKCFGAGQPMPQSSCNSEVGDERALNYLDRDDDADGVPDVVEELSVSAGTATLNVKSSKRRFNLLDAFPQSFRVNAHDSDTGSSVTMSLESDLNIDGSPESGISQSTDSSGATQSIHKKGINAVNVKLAVTGSVEGDKARHDLEYDSDDDGNPEQEISSSIVPTRAQHAINTKGTGAQGGRVASSLSSTDLDSAVTEVSGLDGTTSSSARLTAQPSGTTTVSVSSTDASSGTPIIKGSALMESSSSGVLHTLEWDADGDGVADRRFTGDCDDDDAGVTIEAGVAVPKFIDITAKAQSAAERADVGMVMGTGSDTTIQIGSDDDDAGVTIQSGVAIPRFIEMNARSQSSAHQAAAGIVLGTGADTAVHLGCDDLSSRISVVPPSAGTYVFDLVVTDNNGLMSMTNSLGAISMQMDGDGRLGIGGAADVSNPIHHSSSGAHLTSGGVWTNASDENLKENFQQVDGAELLEKIEELPINQWNYKSESDEVTHIGPTAQDFQKIFGIGGDNKTISTIDPSGIALAAIKELSKQNQQLQTESRGLKEQNAKLQKQLDELVRKVDQLTSSK